MITINVLMMVVHLMEDVTTILFNVMIKTCVLRTPVIKTLDAFSPQSLMMIMTNVPLIHAVQNQESNTYQFLVMITMLVQPILAILPKDVNIKILCAMIKMLVQQMDVTNLLAATLKK
jgi:hypothetical protein